MSQFQTFLRDARRNEKITLFNRKSDRLDKMFHSILHDSKDAKLLWNIVRILLTLSHGQASVERGFSINKEASVVNLGQQNLIAKRVIKDYVYHNGGVKNIVLSESLLKSAKHARQKYDIHFKEKESEEKSKTNDGKKTSIQNQLNLLKQRKKAIQREIEVMESDAAVFYTRAEEDHDFTRLSEANAFSRSVKDKRLQLTALTGKTELQK